jgi:hypothetical protein
MFIASWSFDMQFGTREESMRTLKEFQGSLPSTGWKAKRSRILMGSIGAPESRVVIEHEFESLSDVEASWDGLHKNAEVFKKWVAAVKPTIVPGSPRWEIYRIVD